MEHNNFTSSDELEGYYIGQVLSTVHNISANGIVWQEVFQNNVTLHKDTIVHIWLGNRTDLLDMVNDIQCGNDLVVHISIVVY